MLRRIFIFIFLIGFVFKTNAQSTKGKDFWFAYIPNLVSVPPDIYISSDQDVTGTITVQGIGYTQAVNVVGGTTARYTLPIGAVPPYNEGIHELAVHVETCEFVTVYAVNPGNASSDATVVFPTSSLGIEYTALNMTGAPNDWGDVVSIVATEDNTDIEITPSVNTDGGELAGVPFTITLNEGEIYLLRHDNGGDDLTGTTIKGVNTANCLPFAVFSGSQCINIGGCGACDHLYEQLLPDNNLGLTYAAIPLAQKNRSHYRVMAIEDNTDVFLNGTLVATLNAGEHYQFANNLYNLITSSLPVTVMQYAEGVNCGGPGDPFQVLLYPIEQSLESITFNAFQTPLVNDFWINILVETVDVPNVVLDGTNIAASFSPFPSDPSYSYARVNVTQGDHTLNTPGGSLATVYGWGNAESFGYCAGAALKDLTNDFAIISSPTCTDDVIQFEAIPDPSTSGFSWDYGDGSPTQTGINSTHNFANAGTFDVTLTKHKTGACDVQIVKPVDIFELPIDITQPDTTVCIGSTIDLNIPVSDTFVVERINDCGDITYNRIHIQYDSIYWSTGDVGRNIQVTPTSDTMIYAYGEQFGSICRAVDSVFIEVIEPLADFAFNDACQTDSICLTDQSTSSAPYNISRYSIDGNLLVNNELDYCFLNNVPGNYDIELFIETDIGCRDSITKTVEVFSQPDADFDFVNACDQESIQFQSTAVPNIGSIIDYQWDIDTDGTTDYSVANFGHTYTQDGLFDVEHIVINSHGCSDTIVKEISVYALPNAVFTVDAVCEDTTTTFTNTSNVNPVDADVITNYEWTFGDGNSSSLENPNHDYLTENIYNAKLLVITNHGCRDSVTHPVSVFPQPSVGFTATNACLGFENVFDDETTISNAYTTNTLTTWEWSFDDGNGSVNQNTNHLYSGSGIYNVQLIVGTDNGCVDSITQQVEVYNQPTADFNFTNACDHEDVEMVSTANSNGGTIDHYFWDIDNNGNVDYTINPAAHTYANDGFYDVMHIVETSNGCRDTIVQEITVYALPEAQFTVDAVCEDATTTFLNNSTITPVDGDVVTTYDWSFGDGNTSNLENPTHNYGTENVYDAKLVITTNFGCKDSINHDVDVYPLPVPDFTPTSVCLEDDSEFNDLSTVSNDHTSNNIVQWNWDFGDGSTSSQPNPINGYAADGTYSAILEVITNHGCREEIIKTVTVHPLPVVSFTGVDLEGCSPVCPNINSTTTINSPSSIAEYEWTFTDGSLYSGANLSECFENNSGSTQFYGLTLTATSNEGCVSTHTENDYVKVYHNPRAEFNFSPDESDIIDSKVEFFNTSLYADMYHWTFGNDGTSSETNPVVVFTKDPDRHIIELVASTNEGCSDTVYEVVDILDRVIFYVPNTFTPDNDNYNETFQPVFSSGYDPQDYTLYIFNRWGEIVFESHDTNVGWDGRYGTNNRKIVKEGTYVWKIEFKETMSDKRHTEKGHVNVLR